MRREAMAAPSGKTIRKALEKDFSTAVVDEIFGMIKQLHEEGMDVKQIEEEVAQHLRHHVEKNMRVLVRGGTVRVPKTLG
jgi:hypothetical protein